MRERAPARFDEAVADDHDEDDRAPGHLLMVGGLFLRKGRWRMSKNGGKLRAGWIVAGLLTASAGAVMAGFPADLGIGVGHDASVGDRGRTAGERGCVYGGGAAAYGWVLRPLLLSASAWEGLGGRACPPPAKT
jgi:hypothetical protein